MLHEIIRYAAIGMFSGVVLFVAGVFACVVMGATVVFLDSDFPFLNWAVTAVHTVFAFIAGWCLWLGSLFFSIGAVTALLAWLCQVIVP